jgi:hypothetical protein
MRAIRLLVIVVAASAPLSSPSSDAAVRGEPARAREQPFTYRPKLVVPEALQPFLEQLTPGKDAFLEEREAEELAARLAELGERLQRDPDGATEVSDFLLAGAFRGGRLQPTDEITLQLVTRLTF